MSSQGEVNIVPKIAGEFKYPRNGDSAYQIALKHGFVGTEEQWLASLKGDKGDKGNSPIKGVDYWNDSDIASIETYCSEYIDTQITQAIGGAY